MRLSELYKQISEIRDIAGEAGIDPIIVLQKDSEGNGYSPLAGTEVGWYEAETSWGGEFFSHEQYEEEPDEYEIENTEHAVVLWPVN